MNKELFLTTLREKLKGLPKEDIDERINFYEEMINDRIDEGKSEEDAIKEIGTIDEVVQSIADETPLLKLVKERIKPKRKLSAWEIVLLVLGFPLWLPLMITGLVLALVAYILIWVLVIVTYSVEISLVGGAIYGIAIFTAYLFRGDMHLISLAMFLMCTGGSFLFYQVCVYATKITISLSKKILIGIKSSFIRKGE